MGLVKLISIYTFEYVVLELATCILRLPFVSPENVAPVDLDWVTVLFPNV